VAPFFESLRINPAPREQREKEILLEANGPFPGEGPVVQQEDKPKR